MKPTKVCQECRVELDGSMFTIMTSHDGYKYHYAYCRPCSAARKRAVRKAAADAREVPMQEVTKPRKVKNLGLVFTDRIKKPSKFPLVPTGPLPSGRMNDLTQNKTAS